MKIFGIYIRVNYNIKLAILKILNTGNDKLNLNSVKIFEFSMIKVIIYKKYKYK